MSDSIAVSLSPLQLDVVIYALELLDEVSKRGMPAWIYERLPSLDKQVLRRVNTLYNLAPFAGSTVRQLRQFVPERQMPPEAGELFDAVTGMATTKILETLRDVLAIYSWIGSVQPTEDPPGIEPSHADADRTEGGK